MDFRSLDETERLRLITALRGNVEDGHTILIDSRDTSFLGTAEEVASHDVIAAIRSLPCHY